MALANQCGIGDRFHIPLLTELFEVVKSVRCHKHLAPDRAKIAASFPRIRA